MSSATKELEEQVAARERLEQAIRELEQQRSMEKQGMSQRAEIEIKSLRKEWENEMSSLIANIQKECNSVFERSTRKTASPSPASVFKSIQKDCNSVFERSNRTIASPSPTSVCIHDEKKWDLYDPIETQRSPLTILTSGGSPPLSVPASMQSPIISDIDRALDETEAIVRSLVGNNSFGV